MASISTFEISKIVTYKSVDKEKIKINRICAHAQCKQKTTKDILWKDHAGHKSKSGRSVRPCSTNSTLFLLFVDKPVKTLQE